MTNCSITSSSLVLNCTRAEKQPFKSFCLFLAVDSGYFAALVLLPCSNLTAAFDIMDHNIVLILGVRPLNCFGLIFLSIYLQICLYKEIAMLLFRLCWTVLKMFNLGWK